MSTITINKDHIEFLYSEDVKNKSSIAANFLNETRSFEQAMNMLIDIRSQLSKVDMGILLHTDFNNIKIPFCNHILYVCYKKYGIEACNKLLEKYFDNNTDFYTLSISPGVTITHLEHYRNHPDTMDIIKSLRRS